MDVTRKPKGFSYFKRFSLLILLFFSLGILGFSADYYVKNGGNDELDGLSDGNAWATIAKVNATSFSPGDNIYFKRGSTWREFLVVPSSGSDGSLITFGAYGSGDKPKILGSIAKNSAGDWTQEGKWLSSTSELSDDFNDNDISDWSVTGDVTASNQRMVVVVDSSGGTADHATKAITSRTEYWMSWRVYFNALGIQSGYYVQGGGCSAKYHVGFANDGGTYKWRVHYWTDAGGAGTGVVTSSVITIGQYCNVLIYWKQDSDGGADSGGDNGIAQLWINGVSVWSKTDIDSDTMSVSTVKLGNNYCSNSVTNTATFYIDDIKVGTSENTTTNIWYASSATEVRQAVFNSEAAFSTRTPFKGELTAQGELWWDSSNTRVYLYSAANPATQYSGSIELCKLQSIITTNSLDYIEFRNLDLRYTSRTALYVANNSDHIVIDGLTIRYAGETYSCNDTYGEWSGAGIWLYNATHITVKNCEISYIWTGVYHQGTAGPYVVTIDNNTISYAIMGGNTPLECHGVAFGGVGTYNFTGSVVSNNHIFEFGNRGISLSHATNMTVEKNTIHDNYGDGINHHDWGIGMGAVLGTQIIRYNHIYNIAGNPGQWDDGCGIFTRTAKNSQIYYNIIHDVIKGFYNAPQGSTGSNDGNSVYNNVFYNCSAYAIWVQDGYSVAEKTEIYLQNNICDGATADIRLEEDIVATGGFNCLMNDASVSKDASSTYSGSTDDLYSTDPKFVDAGSNDFSLQDESPCIDEGKNVGLNQDYIGTSLPQGDGVDIGAYESIFGVLNNIIIDINRGIIISIEIKIENIRKKKE